MKTKFLLLLGCLTWMCPHTVSAKSADLNESRSDTTTFTVRTVNETSFIQSSDMKKEWRNSFTQAISIPPQAGIKSLIALKKLLHSPAQFYNPGNTLVIYADKEMQGLVADAAEGYVTLCLDLSAHGKSAIVAGDICPVTPADGKKDYDFKFVQRKDKGNNFNK